MSLLLLPLAALSLVQGQRAGDSPGHSTRADTSKRADGPAVGDQGRTREQESGPERPGTEGDGFRGDGAKPGPGVLQDTGPVLKLSGPETQGETGAQEAAWGAGGGPGPEKQRRQAHEAAGPESARPSVRTLALPRPVCDVRLHSGWGHRRSGSPPAPKPPSAAHPKPPGSGLSSLSEGPPPSLGRAHPAPQPQRRLPPPPPPPAWSSSPSPARSVCPRPVAARPRLKISRRAISRRGRGDLLPAQGWGTRPPPALSPHGRHRPGCDRGPRCVARDPPGRARCPPPPEALPGLTAFAE
ncbi:basic salivary proline-rich protein 4-like [Eschrichtius robustus]|uniref:basic salivary proline-rich protein 4-like n=1 Tax=Eschrichtius robustus TaxID=9764 RepID=UPI0035C02C4D